MLPNLDPEAATKKPRKVRKKPLAYFAPIDILFLLLNAAAFVFAILGVIFAYTRNAKADDNYFRAIVSLDVVGLACTLTVIILDVIYLSCCQDRRTAILIALLCLLFVAFLMFAIGAGLYYRDGYVPRGDWIIPVCTLAIFSVIYQVVCYIQEVRGLKDE
ncbi:unnamed protein product [Calicophoron daubneyi]|uniref:Uncharacterized protein n=1 Tax=Calicophoron daubneyi TaxID=300641 RepID=A0AAV2TJW3_CALDB